MLSEILKVSRFDRKSKKIMEVLPCPKIQKFRCSQVLLKLEPGDQVKLGLFPLTLSLSLGKCVCLCECVCVCLRRAECLFVALDGRGPGPGKKEALSHQEQKKSKAASPGKFSSQIP